MELTPEILERIEQVRLEAAVAQERQTNRNLTKEVKKLAWVEAAYARRAASLHLGEGKQFKPIPGHERYGLAPDGTLKAPTRGGYFIYKRPSKVKKGKYPHYCIDGKYILCHHLVMLTYGTPRPDGPRQYLRHLDDDPNNFSIENLAWGTGAENYRDQIINNFDEWMTGKLHWKQRLTPEDVIHILYKLECGEQISMIAKQYNIERSAIRNIKNGLAWRFVREQIYPEWKRRVVN